MAKLTQGDVTLQRPAGFAHAIAGVKVHPRTSCMSNSCFGVTCLHSKGVVPTAPEPRMSVRSCDVFVADASLSSAMPCSILSRLTKVQHGASRLSESAPIRINAMG